MSSIPSDIRDLLAQVGYGLDIAKCGFFITPANRQHVYEMHIYDDGSRGWPDEYDCDSFEIVRPGEADGVREWIFGHTGLDIFSVESANLMSPEDCFDFFYTRLFGGMLTANLPRLPKVGSAPELKLWLAAAGK